MRLLKKILLIAQKDLRSELRSRDQLSTMFTFVLLTMIIYGFALDQNDPKGRELIGVFAPGLLWVVLTFAGVIVLSRSFATERENDCLLGLLLAPVDRSAIFFGKALANLVIILLVEIVAVPLFGLLFNQPLFSLAHPLASIIFPIFGVITLGMIGFVLVGTFLSALALNTRASEVLLSILLLPLYIPVLIAGVRLTQAFFGRGGIDIFTGIQILVAYDLMFGTLSWLLFEFVIER